MKKKTSIIIKSIAIISALFGLAKICTNLMSITYFTTLSNVFVIIMLSLFLIKEIFNLKYKKYLYIIKFLSTISISLTFLVFLFLLAPTLDSGFINAYLMNDAGSLCVHFITPVLSIIDFLLFDREYKLNKINALHATIPPLIYVLFVVIGSQLGLRWGKMYAPYNFLNYHAKTGWFGFDLSLLGWETLGIGVFYNILFLTIIFILIGLLFIWIKNRKKM